MRACMLAYTFYENDNRVMRYAETLAHRGEVVDVISLRKQGQKYTTKIGGVRIFRIQKRSLNERQGKFNYLLRLIVFFILSFIFLTIRHLTAPYRIIHIHSVPDFEVFAAIIAKILGARVILDIHDIIPEFYASKFGKDMNSFTIRNLKIIERMSTAFADHVIIANHIWYDRLVSRGIPKKKISVLLNYPDKQLFYPRERKRKDGFFKIMYPGTISKHQGLEIAIRALNIIKTTVKGIEFYIFGEGPDKNRIERYVKSLGISGIVYFNKGLPLKEIACKMHLADIGIVPKVSNLFGNEAFSTKTLEFMASGIPIIVSDTKVDKYYFNDNIVEFFKSGNPNDLAKKILLLYKDKKRRDILVQNGLKFIEKNNWGEKKNEYLRIIDVLKTRINTTFIARRLYYIIRPIIPRPLQIAIRRRLYLLKAKTIQTKWPINLASPKTPNGWTGWPNGKQFALVLSHDVETTKGLHRCGQIVEEEKKLGFRSCFSFVPKRYEVQPDLISFLWKNGFEVGVHGLYHDGKLYNSRKIFLKRASQINEYIEKWQSIGFYSPSMHHNLEWIHELNIEYDNSTFDMDPFEPQPDGVGTMFPFIVRNTDRSKSYVELPYTLPQDFTLFVIMKEVSCNIWKNKTKWIAQHNGMVLLKTHPDYMSFSKSKTKLGEYPFSYYIEFLQYLKDEYSNNFWNALPCQVAKYWKSGLRQSFVISLF